LLEANNPVSRKEKTSSQDYENYALIQMRTFRLWLIPQCLFIQHAYFN